VLAASVWLWAVERFQEGYLAALRQSEPRAAARAAAAHVLRWSRQNLDDARLLLLYRSSQLVGASWPAELEVRNLAQRTRAESALGELSRRLGARTAVDRRRVVFATVDIPYGAVRTPLSRGVPPEPELDALVDDAVLAVIEGIGRTRRG
jgi:hypothetical protein